jgi:hypothetical protein
MGPNFHLSFLPMMTHTLPIMALAVLLSTLSRPVVLPAATDAAFLLVEPAVQAVAAGGASVAVDGKLSATTYNPACLANLPRLTGAFSHLETFGDWTHDWVCIGVPVGSMVLAADFMWSRVKPFELYDDDGSSMGMAEAGSQVYGLCGAWAPLADKLRLGLGFRYFNSQLAMFKSWGYALSGGVQSKPFNWPLRFGLSAQNFGDQTAYYAEADELPALLRAGMAWQAPGTEKLNTQLRGDYVLFLDPLLPPQVRLGAEVMLLGHLQLDAGLQSDSLGLRPSFGAGFHADFLQVSYAYLPNQIFGASQRFGLEISGL